MSFFSDISGFNSKAIKNIYEEKNDKYDFSEVDFCINDEESTLFGTQNSKDDFALFDFNSDYDDYSSFENIDFEG